MRLKRKMKSLTDKEIEFLYNYLTIDIELNDNDEKIRDNIMRKLT